MGEEQQPLSKGAGPSRRAVLAGLVAGIGGAGVLSLFPLETRAEAVEVPARPEDEAFMREAIALAKAADYPFGAVITRGGDVLARGMNLGRRLADPTAHGEMVAIRRFLAVRPPDELKGTTLYTSGEPCAMCMGAIVWCGISRVVFAANVEELAARIGQITISAKQVAEETPFARVELTGGVLSGEALALFDQKKP
ncbi:MULTISPECIES: nucleoside deaminase [unclassified Xanthobacter]|uniref:nucleoside deaminase n=1 Tax=unclassified Xanthobacter TaxID=2623496 RepID=UPI001EE11FF1|nr:MULTISPECIES: nucleoside deaminase [unclassified Xanthobacter]